MREHKLSASAACMHWLPVIWLVGAEEVGPSGDFPGGMPRGPRLALDGHVTQDKRMAVIKKITCIFSGHVSR